MSTKVDIVSGFLGAGKTTFIKKLIGDTLKGEKVVLIENEFGEIGIDGGFLKDSGIEIREMSQGCICCSLVGDFAASMKEILTNYRPDRIIIEPSGVGKLSDVMKAIAGAEDELDVENNSAITVVDVKKAKLYSRNFGEFFNNQIQYATTIVLSRTDIADQAKIDAACEIIRSINPTCTIITTPIANLSGAKLLEILESPVDLKKEMLAMEPDGEDPEEHEHHHHHHHNHEEHEHDHDHDEEEHGHHHHHDDDDDDEDEDEHEHHHEHCDHHECGHEPGDEGCKHHHHHEHDEHEEDEHEHHHHEHHHHHHHGHDADEIFESWGIEAAPAYDEAELKEKLDKISETEEFGQIVRAKGIVQSKADPKIWLYFDMVPGEVEIRHGEPDATGKLCVIGAELKEEELEKLFK